MNNEQTGARKAGRPAVLTGRKRITMTLDDATLAAIEAVNAEYEHKSRSKALRHIVHMWQERV